MHYIMKDREAIPCPMTEWAKWFQKRGRHVGYDHVEGYLVSTVFVGVDYQLGVGRPLLFETLIRHPKYPDSEMRHSTWKEARAHHNRLVRLIRKHKRLPPGKPRRISFD